MNERSVGFLVGGLLILFLVIYAIIVFFAWRDNAWIFARYHPPPLENGFQPGGPLVELTPAQIQLRRSCITGGVCTPEQS